MSIPPIPPPLEHLGKRKFSFYPAIINIDHNEWTYQKATWSEILVTNEHSRQEIWVPRRFLGEVSRVDDPVLIVGLNKELEYSAGSVWPHRRRVIEMPIAVNDGPVAVVPRKESSGPAQVVGIRLEPTEKRAGRMVIGALTLGAVGVLVLAGVARQAQYRQRYVMTAKDAAFADLRRGDDYYAVVRHLGAPESEHSSPATGSIHYRILEYPSRGYSAILFGADLNTLRYIGAVDKHCVAIHSITEADGTDSSALLRNLAPNTACVAR